MAIEHVGGPPKGFHDLCPIGKVPHLLNRIGEKAAALQLVVVIGAQCLDFVRLGLSARRDQQRCPSCRMTVVALIAVVWLSPPRIKLPRVARSSLWPS